MKLPLLLGWLVALTASVSAQTVPTVPSTEAKDHVGQYAHVFGTVAEVHLSTKGDAFIRFDQPFPDADFSAVIFAEDRQKFGDITHLQGKTITVTGTIRLFHDKPEVFLKGRQQLEMK